MIQTFLIVLAIFGVAFAGMAIGVIVSNRRIKGTCGGLNNFKDGSGNSVCDACTTPSPSCTGNPQNREAQAVEG
ncbi:hypothetical protein Mal64_06170 [Pseudobythopirellula maris]|uniref:(Na+)-NQR maturation NqrM n=1 Tax=Pseudobythopirellula maris TaxID=2527991 RepID=A0A5C5ZVI6_9BACT|nr:(Na+)-NQR maturation NqrM [Pseudobythopirellula maris]TWT90233.1 hypothetical protein Mal64_06170 [Pseudobythopirellula maris]